MIDENEQQDQIVEGQGRDVEKRVPKGGWKASLILLFASLLVSLLILEGGLRLFLPPISSSDMNIPDPEIGKTLRPGYQGIELGVQVRINSHGLRSPEVPIEKPEGTFRILVLGDSWTFGVGVPQDRTYPAQLQRILRDRFPERDIEVINAGVSGYETYNESVYFRREGCRFDPDVVVIGYYPVNDVHDKKSRFERRARERAEHPIWYAVKRFPSNHLYSYQYLDYYRAQIKHAYREWRYSQPIHDAGPEDLDERYEVEWTSLYREDFPGWIVAKESLADIAEQASSIDSRVILAVFPDLRSLKHYRTALKERYFPKLENAAAEAGIVTIDLAPSFYPYEGREEEISLGNTKGSTHPNAEGCRLLAEYLAERLVALGYLTNGTDPSPGSSPH